MFPLGPEKQPVEAVKYIDGDGGYIVAELFPGFFMPKEHVHPVTLKQHEYTLVPFREQHHDVHTLLVLSVSVCTHACLLMIHIVHMCV